MLADGAFPTRPWRMSGVRPPAYSRAAAVLLALWLALVVVTGIDKPGFLGYSTYVTIAYGMAVTGVMAVGVATVMLSGGVIDLSVAANAAFAGELTAILLQHGVPSAPVALLVLAFGAGFGAVNGLLIVFARLSPIITTLGTSFVASGILNLVGGFEPVPAESALRAFGRERFLGTPEIFWAMILMLAATGFFLARTRPGRHAVAVGGSRLAAISRGISIPRVRLVTFVFCGICAAAGGILIAAQLDIVQTSIATDTQFRVPTAVILGGISLRGGQGNFLGLFASVLFISTLPTALTALDLSSAWEAVFQGGLLALAVGIDALRRVRETR